MKKNTLIKLTVLLLATTLSGCSKPDKITVVSPIEIAPKEFSFKVDPSTFELSLSLDGLEEIASSPLPQMEVTNLIESDSHTSWHYPNEQIDVSIDKKDGYLDVALTSTADETSQFTWPYVSGQSYVLPLHEGKYIPSNDSYWLEYLSTHSTYTVMESFSMQFFSVNKENYSIVYVMNNPFNNEINFSTDENITFSFTHEYPSINENKTYGFRIYLTDNNISDIAKTYKADRIERGLFKTLEEKSQSNTAIQKLYGAPHIYFWDKSIISESDINWKLFKEAFPNPLTNWIQQLLTKSIEDGSELAAIFDELSTQDYISQFQKSQIIKSFNQVLQLRTFYNPNIFTSLPKDLEVTDIAKMSKPELIEFNKKLLKSQTEAMTTPIHTWARYNTIDILDEMKAAGLEKAWIGFDDIASGYVSPAFIQKAISYGYLVGPYDSYHSIHEPGNEKWSTATFEDTSLYDSSTIENEKGEKLAGFQKEGRKLNPNLSLPSVKDRVAGIIDDGYNFNSWFIDVDAAGEVHDDYSPSHITTQEEDLNARLERMAYIRDSANVVIGSEGGNDYASTTIAFAHGLETPAFSWVDPDMQSNRESKYYVGKYYSPTGGAPEVFAKQVPLKELYNKIFISPEYSIPLFKLVYNDSVISSYQWLWGTFKIADETDTRMLKEILYNTPPMYHIDRTEWEKYKDPIISHTQVWSEFNQEAITKEMTNFEFLTLDRLVQLTEFQDTLKVVANFSTEDFTYESDVLGPNTLIIYNGDEKTVYHPNA